MFSAHYHLMLDAGLWMLVSEAEIPSLAGMK